MSCQRGRRRRTRTAGGKPDAMQREPRKMTSFRSFWEQGVIFRKFQPSLSNVSPGRKYQLKILPPLRMLFVPKASETCQLLDIWLHEALSRPLERQIDRAFETKRKKDAAPRGTASEREEESKSRAFATLTAPRAHREQQEVASRTKARRALHTRDKRAHRKEARCRTKGISLFQAGRSPFPTRTLRSGCKTYTPRLSSFPVRSKTPTHALRAYAA